MSIVRNTLYLQLLTEFSSQEVHPETTRTGIWFRNSLRHMFNICRIPQTSCDVLSSPPSPSSPEAHKITVMVGGWCYSLTALESPTELVSISKVQSALRSIVNDAESRRRAGEIPLDIGSLSADDRTKWAAVSLPCPSYPVRFSFPNRISFTS